MPLYDLIFDFGPTGVQCLYALRLAIHKGIALHRFSYINEPPTIESHILIWIGAHDRDKIQLFLI